MFLLKYFQLCDTKHRRKVLRVWEEGKEEEDDDEKKQLEFD